MDALMVTMERRKNLFLSLDTTMLIFRSGHMLGVTNWIDDHGRSKSRPLEGSRGGWFSGETSRGRRQAALDLSPPPSQEAHLGNEEHSATCGEQKET
jgi:hypothetical protein